MNESERVRRWVESKRKSCPGGCGATVHYQTTLCRSCTAKQKREIALDRTLAQVKSENNSKRWTDHVRYFSREMYKDVLTTCSLCEYNKHVEIAHIKDVSTFPDSATIREVNSENNVMGLCPNHHWEFDAGLL
jgi:predicted restriction endonuclease